MISVMTTIMPKQPIVQTFVVRVECSKEIPHLIDMVAGRAYTIDGVEAATATRVEPLTLNGAGLTRLTTEPVEVFKPI